MTLQIKYWTNVLIQNNKGLGIEEEWLWAMFSLGKPQIMLV